MCYFYYSIDSETLCLCSFLRVKSTNWCSWNLIQIPASLSAGQLCYVLSTQCSGTWWGSAEIYGYVTLMSSKIIWDWRSSHLRSQKTILRRAYFALQRKKIPMSSFIPSSDPATSVTLPWDRNGHDITDCYSFTRWGLDIWETSITSLEGNTSSEKHIQKGSGLSPDHRKFNVLNGTIQ